MVSLRITPDYTSDRADVVGLLYGNDNATVTIANFADELRATSRVRIVLNDDTLLTVGSLTPENENDVRGNLIVRGVPLIEHISRKMREPTQVGVKVIIDDAEDESAPTYTGRTMLLLNWDEHDPSNPEPSVPGNYIPVTSIANLPDHYKDSDMKAKIDEICAIIRQSATALAFAFLLPFFSQAASVQVFTADKQDIYNDGKIVTNVTLDASGLATDEQVQANSEKIAAVSNDVRTVDAKVETHKVREDNPHNVTADQVGSYTKAETDSKIAGHVPPPPPNYDVVSNRAMTALQSYTETDPVFAAWLALGPFAPFATMEWVNGRGFATQNWVGEQGFLKSYTETDPTVPAWAKQANPPEGMTDNALVWTNNAVKTKRGAKTVGAADVGAYEKKDGITIGPDLFGHNSVILEDGGYTVEVSSGIRGFGYGVGFSINDYGAEFYVNDFGQIGYGIDEIYRGVLHDDRYNYYDYYFPPESGTFALETWQSLSAMIDSATNQTARTTAGAKVMTLIDQPVQQKIDNAVSANLNTYIDGETGVEYIGKFYGGSLYYVPTGNVYPPNN